jgi:hypothetical protein
LRNWPELKANKYHIMKITDVIELVEAAAYGAPGSRAMGSANFALLSRHYTKPANRTSANLVLDFGGGRQVELSDTDVDAIAKYYDTLPTDADRYDFVYEKTACTTYPYFKSNCHGLERARSKKKFQH